MRESALADIRRALAGDERLHRELELRAAGTPRDGLLPRWLLYDRVMAILREGFPSRLAELASVVRPMVWPHGVAGNGFHLDGSAGVEGGIPDEGDVFPSLIVLHGRMCGMVFLLPPARLPLVLGRGQACDLRLMHEGLSRRQAIFSRDGDGNTTIEDLRSTAGSWVNDRITRGPTVLRDGDGLRLNAARLRFRAAVTPPP